MEERDWIPDLVLCSTATRAQRTLSIAVGDWSHLPDVRSMRSLYLAAPARILEIVERQPASVERLMIVGHNPGLHSFSLRMCGPGPLRRPLEEKLPTAALVRIGFDQPSWKDLRPGELLDVIKPRELADS